MVTQYIGTNSTLFVTFCSWLKPDIINGKHDFENSLLAFDKYSHRIFLKDTTNKWFISGTISYPSINKLLKYIHKYIIIHNIGKIIFLGASMGGYAAILYRKIIFYFI